MTTVLPNFLIAGAAKSATTSLHEYLAQHPEIFMSANKEPHYFVHGTGENKWAWYVELFKNAGGKKIIGESSTGYLYSEESPKWIKAILGNIKTVSMLRNPAHRAFSLYCWMIREGYEDAPTFKAALDREPARMADSNFFWYNPQFYPNYLYHASGLYSRQVRRYLDTFGPDNVRIYLFEDFTRDPLAICRSIFSFLGVNPDFVPRMEIHNEGRIPFSISRQYWLRNKLGPQLRRIHSEMGEKVMRRLMDRNIQRGGRPSPDPRILSELIARSREDIGRLEDLLGIDLSVWLKPQS
jgi:hypothetical protein